MTQFTQLWPFSSFEEINVLSLIPWLFVHLLGVGQDQSSSALCIWLTVFLLHLQFPGLLQSSQTFHSPPHSSVPLRTAFCLLTRGICSLISSKPTSHYPLDKVLPKREKKEGEWRRPGGEEAWRWLCQMGTGRVDRTQSPEQGNGPAGATQPPGCVTLGLSGPHDLIVWRSWTRGFWVLSSSEHPKPNYYPKHLLCWTNMYWHLSLDSEILSLFLPLFCISQIVYANFLLLIMCVCAYVHKTKISVVLERKWKRFFFKRGKMNKI